MIKEIALYNLTIIKFYYKTTHIINYYHQQPVEFLKPKRKAKFAV